MYDGVGLIGWIVYVDYVNIWCYYLLSLNMRVIMWWLVKELIFSLVYV